MPDDILTKLRTGAELTEQEREDVATTLEVGMTEHRLECGHGQYCRTCQRLDRLGLLSKGESDG